MYAVKADLTGLFTTRASNLENLYPFPRKLSGKTHAESAP